jgi:hypothetical protein
MMQGSENNNAHGGNEMPFTLEAAKNEFCQLRQSIRNAACGLDVNGLAEIVRMRRQTKASRAQVAELMFWEECMDEETMVFSSRY